MDETLILLRQVFREITLFAQYGGQLKLRRYQVDVARAIVESVMGGLGLTIVVVFPRQSGKNELQAQVEAYLLAILSEHDAEIVKVSPTWKPQTLNAMRRLQRALERNVLMQNRWRKESGYIYRVGAGRIFFLSGSPTTSVVGATASTLLECDEAQDVLPAKWDKDFAPMAASTNATRVFWGTMWTANTLLARELRLARRQEQQDGRRRVFVLTAVDVAAEVPAYGKFVAEQSAKLGRNHPLVRTQYFSEEMDAEGGMFPPRRQALMQGEHSPRPGPHPGPLPPEERRRPSSLLPLPPGEGRGEGGGELYALLLDVAGEDEGGSEQMNGDQFSVMGDQLGNQRRDSTALTVVSVDLATLADDLVRAPTYRVVQRYAWVGVRHTALYGRIKALAEHWGARYLVVDATGVGAGLASFLDKALPGRVVPFIFSARSKSDLGWGFLAVIETGRYKEYVGTLERSNLQTLFWRQVEFCQSTVLDGPGKLMRWGVPDGARDPQTGELLHDDLLVSAALCAVLDGLPWPSGGPALIVPGRDPLEEMDRF